MSTHGEAAEQIVNMATTVTLKGAEVMGNLTGKGLVSLATFLIAALAAQKRTKGKTRLQSFNGKPTKVFVIKQEDLERFAQEAKRYGILYAAVFNKKRPDGLIDVVVNANDAAKVNRIAERFALSTVDISKIRKDIIDGQKKKSEQDAQKQRTTPPDEKPKAADAKEKSQAPTEPQNGNPHVQPVNAANPTSAWPEPAKSNPSAPSSEPRKHTEQVTDNCSKNGFSKPEDDRASIRDTIAEKKQERKERAELVKAQPSKERTHERSAQNPKVKKRKSKGR